MGNRPRGEPHWIVQAAVVTLLGLVLVWGGVNDWRFPWLGAAGSSSASPAPASSLPAPPSSEPSSGGAADPKPTTPSAVVESPAARSDDVPAGIAPEIVVSAASATGSLFTSDEGVETRFWAYDGEDVLGGVRYENGGPAGVYGWAPEGLGDCGLPYVSYEVARIPAGDYRVQVYVPDLDGLSSAVRYEGLYTTNPQGSSRVVVDQAAHRGGWYELGTIRSNELVDGIHGLWIQVAQYRDDTSRIGACTLGDGIVTFDAIGFTLTN